MSGFWDWALEAYARAGVAEACLDLQDGHAQNVPYLLWAAWSAGEGVNLDGETLEAGCDVARAWETAAIRPLRAIRTTLAKPIPDIGHEGRFDIREGIKALELGAERRLMAELEALSAAAPRGASADPETALASAARAWSPTVPRAALVRLARALST